jgi:hypothetical protein
VPGLFLYSSFVFLNDQKIKFIFYNSVFIYIYKIINQTPDFMKKVILLLHAALLTSTLALAQTTVTFKPGPAVGEDVNLWVLDGNCTPSGYPLPAGDLNFGSSGEASFTRWTWNALNCGEGTTRELMRFTELSTIPTGATILSAELRLNGPTPTGQWGNNYYPGTPLPNTNPGWVKRVLPGANNPSSPDNWDENVVTWNTQPNTDPNPANWAPIGLTGSRWGFLQSIDVTNIVQQIVTELGTDAYANNGFLLQLQTEVYYRSQCYSSSDGADSTLWPELIVKYEYCDANFSYCSNTTHPYTYDFTANDATQVNYDWIVDGNYVSSGPSLNYNFPGAGSYTVCLKVYDKNGKGCDKCIKLCKADNEKGKAAPQQKAAPAGKTTPRHGNIIKSDDPAALIGDKQIQVMPNPAKEGWNLSFKANAQQIVRCTIYDVAGKELSSGQMEVARGANSVYLPAGQLKAGIYFIGVKGEGINLKEKVVKE